MNNDLIKKITGDRQLDPEWVDLILEALEIGVSIDEIKNFITKNGSPTT